MGKTNELDGGEAVNLILSKRFDIQGAPAPFMASELFPMIVLENDRPEWGFLANSRLCGGQIVDGAVVGEFSHVGVRNRQGSGVLLVLESAEIVAAAAFIANFGFSADQTFDAAVAAVFLDTRYGFSQSPTGQLVTQTSVGDAIAARWGTVRTAGIGNIELIKKPVVIGPGFEFLCAPSAQNVAIQANFRWYERAANPGELNQPAVITS